LNKVGAGVEHVANRLESIATVNITRAAIKADGGGAETNIMAPKVDHKGVDSSQYIYSVLEATLHKAKAAILLEAVWDFAGAIVFYREACILLQRATWRTSRDEYLRNMDVIVS
jgi:hypothetical protein